MRILTRRCRHQLTKNFIIAFTVLIDLNNLLDLVQKSSRFFFPSLCNVYKIRPNFNVSPNIFVKKEKNWGGKKMKEIFEKLHPLTWIFL